MVRNAKTPSEAKYLGNSRKLPLRSDWEEVKETFMFNCVYAKFTQHEDLKNILLDTKDLYLNERAPDSYWGDGME
jgi:N-glycosidase YbiA